MEFKDDHDVEDNVPLMRCPFCGGKAEIVDLGGIGFGRYFARCTKCYVNQDTLYPQKYLARKAWNRRIR